MRTWLRITALALVLAALAVVPAATDLRAHSPGSASLIALSVNAGVEPQTLAPAFSSTVYSYTVHVDNSVAQVTVTGTPDGDGTVTAAQQVNLPTLGGKRVNVVVTHTDSGTTTTQTYTVRVIREGTVATDRAALMALYNSTGGANWGDNTNWGTDQPISTWYGVYTLNNGRVGDVNLNDNNLVGTLPAALGNLDQMYWLYLENNWLSGSIPASLGELTNLTLLYLNQNQLSGSIPASLGDLASLEQLSLWENQLTGEIPEELGNLASLTHLYLGGNALSGSIPEELGNLASLRNLSLWGNTLTGEIPAELGDLASLEYLSLGGNALSGTLPASLGNLANLKNLSLWDNELSGRLPDSLGNLTSLETLDISRNSLDGPIPDLSRLANLQWLYLWDNQLSGTIPALNSLTSLKELYLNRNALTGTIPNLSALTSLTHLYLNDNQLSGAIPTLSSLSSLVELDLGSNQLSGPIPSLSSLTSLVKLDLNANVLSGTIPDLSSLSNLQQLRLDNNDFGGEIPTSLGDLTRLTNLSLDNNELTGTIPDLSRLGNLIWLTLLNNQLSGPIPAWLGQLTNLQYLYLGYNELSGDFPAALGSLTTLKVTRFALNRDADGNPSLTGCVPLGLRYLLTAPDFESDEYDEDRRPLNLPAQDFIAEDVNNDGDTDDRVDTPGLNLPFCMLSALTFTDVSLDTAFTSGTAAYSASVDNTVASTTVTATLDADADSSDRLSIRKGTASYTSGASLPLAVGPNEITITVTPTDGAPTLTYSVTVFRTGEDRPTLIALYNSAGGANWTNKDNWGSTAPLNDWFGVTADDSENVTALDLSGNNLRGTLPSDLGTLTSLTTLDLSDNGLSGTIPDLTALTSLLDLDLGDNQLSGTIPDWLGSLTALQELSLRDNRLTGAIPEELGDLTQLDLLYLDDNRLSGAIPAELGNLNQLDVTRFAGNTLTGCVPDGLRDLVGAAQFESLPAHDFIAVDANDDGDTDDDGDTPGLGLPFCTLRALTLSGVTLAPGFASDVVVYTASARHAVTSPRVTATPYESSDSISIMTGLDTYSNYGVIPLAVGTNVISIEITPADDTPAHTYTATVTRAPNTPPAFDDGATTTRGVDENTIAGVGIGAAVEATDADGDTLTYSLDAAGAESFEIDHETGQLRTQADLDFEDESRYTVTVSVRDSKDDNSDPDEVTDDTITVTILVADMNEAPEFPRDAETRSVDENTAAGENIGDPVAATDDDNDTLTYSLDVTSQASFDIVPTTGQLQTRVALDFEDGPRDYTVTVTATDPVGADDTIRVSITVDDVDEAGTVTLSSVQPIVDGVLTATVSDPDTILNVTEWEWESSTNRTTWTTVTENIEDVLRSSYPALAADVGRYLRATAFYTDGFGAGKSARAVSVNRVQPAPVGPNIPPQFLANVIGERDVDENTPAGVDIGAPVAATDRDGDQLTYTLDDAGAESFDINRDTGQLQTKVALDYETTANYFVDVTATDTAGEDDTIEVDIDVNNVDEPGSVMLSSQQPLVGIPLTATLHDPDVVVPGSVAWLWERSPDGVSDWTPISREIVSIYTPVADDVSDYLRATASYTDYEGFDTKSVQAISTNAVDPEPGRNPPMLTEHPTATRSILRNTPAGTDIGEPFTATDADNDALTYSLGGPDRATFDLDASSGQLRTRAVLDGIARKTYKVFVSVSDGKDEQGFPETDPQVDATTDVTITVTTPRTTGGGGGGGFGAGPGEIQLVVTAAVAGEEAPSGQRFGFAFNCTPPEGQPPNAWTFSLGAGQASGRFVPGKIPCSLTVTDDGGADAVDGLFTDRVLGEEALRLVVTFTYGIVTTSVPLDAATVVEDGAVSLTIPAGSRDAPYSVLLETDSESCEAALDLEGESIACHTVTVFDADGAEETGVTLLVPATITITLDAAQTEALGGIDGVRAARQRGELRMLQRADAESPWQEIPFTVRETDDGGVVIVVSVQQFSDFALATATPRLQTIALHAGWTVVVWDGADGASVVDALGGLGASAGGSDVSAQVGVVYHWLAETQTWASFRPGVPAFLSGFDTLERGASYWVQSSDAVEWTIVGGPLEPPAAEPTRLHSGWTEVVWRGPDGAGIAEAFGMDVFPQVEVIYRWLGETQTWTSFRPGAPAFLSAFDTFASGGSYWIAVAEGVEWVVGPDGG